MVKDVPRETKVVKFDHFKNMSEADIQRQCFSWFGFQHREYSKRIFAIPNGGKRDIVTAVKLKQQGTLSGAWDIFLSVPKQRYSGLFIEMKAGKNKLTENQVEFMEANKNDYLFRVCYSLEDFKREVNNYLKNQQTNELK